MIGTGIAIRLMRCEDATDWAKMRAELWPEEALAVHTAQIDTLLNDPDVWGFVAETAESAAIGFAEVAIRKYANGCESQPVAFLEGIWVSEEFRRRGVATRLIRHVEQFLSGRGFRELGSDALIDNLIAQAAHAGWGFSETERVVYYRKHLANRST